MKKRLHLKIERRKQVGIGLQILAILLALFASALVTALLMVIANGDVLVGFEAIFEGSIGNWKNLVETLVKSTPLIFTGLATVIAFRGQVWNIGQEGQLYAGAIFAYWAYLTFSNLPPFIMITFVFIFAIIGGAFWGWIAAFIKTRYNVDVIITTIMLNYIILYVLSWLLSNIWRDPTSYYQQSPLVADAAKLPIVIPGTRLHIGFVIAVAATFVIYFLIDKTPLGFEIRSFGSNPIASRFQGINTTHILITIMLISGALAGLGGASKLFGVNQRLKASISLGYGYTGIIIGILAGLEPLAVLPAAIFFGALINGTFYLQITTGVPSSLVNAIQAIVMLFMVSARIIVSFRIRRSND